MSTDREEVQRSVRDGLERGERGPNLIPDLLTRLRAHLLDAVEVSCACGRTETLRARAVHPAPCHACQALDAFYARVPWFAPDGRWPSDAEAARWASRSPS